jgi:hypothetical protein
MSNEHREAISVLVHISEEPMTAPWHEGDTSSGICYACRKPVTARFETRSIKLNRSRITFPNILVSVCTECNEMIDMPKQSLAQFRELGSWK